MKNNLACFKSCFNRGICAENPTFRLMLGLCPTLAVTVTLENGLAMGLAATFVLIGSNIIISLIRNFVPSEVRIPCYILVIATFVTIVKLVLQAYFPLLYAKLGLFVDIMVVNCIILGRAEAFASKNQVFLSIADAFGMGIGFTLATGAIGAIREIIGSGKLLGIPLGAGYFTPALIMILPPGAFLTIGLIMAFLNKMQALSCARQKAN
ncbi:MAG: electron transport complex subunit E [Candidatus Omnitrophica bacterium]|nr:electron transport complex subunit E [Candidatus Omnitrophota bacterium]MBU1924461.1 electron transport complex subunit E [Candidatus Omnitrophota bacterium]